MKFGQNLTAEQADARARARRRHSNQVNPTNNGSFEKAFGLPEQENRPPTPGTPEAEATATLAECPKRKGLGPLDRQMLQAGETKERDFYSSTMRLEVDEYGDPTGRLIPKNNALAQVPENFSNEQSNHTAPPPVKMNLFQAHFDAMHYKEHNKQQVPAILAELTSTVAEAGPVATPLLTRWRTGKALEAKPTASASLPSVIQRPGQ